MSKKTTAIYNALSANGDFKGSEQDFNKKFFAPGKAGYEYRKGVYDTLHKGGADVGSSYEEFVQLIGLRAVPRQQQQVQQQAQQAKPQTKPTTSTPMTDAEKRAMIGNTADMVAQTGQQIAQTGRAIEHAKRHTGLDVRTPKLGQNRNVDKVQDPVSGQVQYETEDGQRYDNEAYATQAQTDIDDMKLVSQLEQAKARKKELERMASERLAQFQRERSMAFSANNDINPYATIVGQAEQDEEYRKIMAEIRKNDAIIGDLSSRTSRITGVDDELNKALEQQAKLEKAASRRRNELASGGSFLEKLAGATKSDLLHGGMRENQDEKEIKDEEYGQLMAAIRQNRQAIQILEDKKNNQMNSFWHSFATAATNGYNFSDGMGDIKDAIAISNAENRLAQINAKRERGETLTREEESAEQVLMATLRNQAMQGKYGDDYGMWARAGAGAPVSIDMMKNIGLGLGLFQDISSGIAKAAINTGYKQLAKATTKGLAKGMARTAIKGMIKATGVTLGSIAGGATISNTTGIGKTIGDAAKMSRGNVNVDKNGNLLIEDKKGLIPSIIESERANIIENGSEMLGEFLPSLVLGKISMAAANKLGLSNVSKFFTQIGTKQWYKQYNRALRASGFNGMPNEMLEEYAGILGNELTGDSEGGLKSLKDFRTHQDIGMGVLTVGALMGAPNVVMAGAGAAQYYRYKHAMERAAKVASYRLTEEKWKPLQEAIDGTPNEGLTDLMMDIYGRKDMEMPEKKAVYDYIHNLVKYRGYNIGTINFNDSRKAEGDPKQNADMAIEGAADAAYTDGYNAQGVDMARAKREYDNATMRVVELLGSDVVDALSQEPVLALKKLHNDGALEDDAVRDAATAFVNAKMKFDGVVQRAKDDLDGMITDAHNSISQRTHQDGAIHPVTLKKDDKRAYVVDGNIAMLDDGTTIDTQNSDDTIIIRGEDGKLEFTSPSAIMSVGDLIDPAEEREMAEQAITQDFGTRRAAEIDGIDENGQPIPLGDEEEQPQAQQGEVTQTEPQPQQAETQQADTTEQDTQETSEQDGAQPMPMVKNKEGEEEPDFMSATPQRAHQYIYDEAELPREVADEFVKNNAKAAQSHLDKVKKKQPKMGTSIAKYKAEQAAYAQEVQAAERAVQYWDEVKAVQEAIDKQQREDMLAKQAAAAAEAKKVEEDRLAQEAAKQNKQEEVIDKAVETPKQSVQQDVTDGREDKDNEPEQGVKADDTTGVTKGADDTLEESGERNDRGSIGKQETEPTATGVERATQGNVANNENNTEVDDSKEELKKLEDFVSSTDSNKRTTINNNEYDAEELYAPLLLDGRKSNLAVTINIPSNITDTSYPIALYDFEHSVNKFDWEMMENALEEYNSHVKEGDKTHMWGDSGKLAFRSVDAAVKFNDWMLTKESKVEKPNDKQEDLMSQAERIAKEDAEQRKFKRNDKKIAKEVAEAEAETDTNPTEAQKESGNYRKGHVRIDGMEISIEQPKGSIRRGTDAKGNKWESEMHNTYGYIRGTQSVDGDHIDVFLSDAPLHGMVYVIDQVNPETGEFDEHKVMYGFESEDAARKAYLSNYEKGWKGLGAITEVSREDFKEWVQGSKRKTKPFAEYKSVKESKETKGEDASGANAVLSQKDYVQKRLSEKLDGSPYKTLEEWETSDIEGYSEQYDNMIAEYPSYLRELAKSEKLQEIYDRSSVKEQKKIREHLEDADIDYKEVLNTSPQRTRVQDRITEEIKYAKGVFSDGTTVSGKVVGQTNESVTIEQNGRKYTIKAKDILEQSDKPISVDKPEFQVDKNDLSSTTDEQELATNAVLSLLEDAGIPVEVVNNEAAKKIIPENAEKHIVYHGSPAKFENFDHSHMGEGEGAQAYGWGSYVTEVEGIGRAYATGNSKIKFRGFVLESMHSLEVKEHFSKAERKVLNFLYRWIKKSYNPSTAIEKAREWASNEYGKYSGRRDWSDQDYKDHFGAINKREVREWRKEMKEKEENAQQMLSFIETLSIDDLSFPQRHLYTVDIPDDTGSNYLSWEQPMTVEQLDAIEAYLKENFSANSVQFFTDGIAKSSASNSEKVDAFTRRGENVYHLLEHILYDDKSVSEMLHSLGYTGISFPAEYQSGGRDDGARNYVIFNEKDLKITDHVQFMKTPQGTIYGWTVGGKIYLTKDGLNPETPIHEYTHIWADAMRRKNADGWNSVKALLKGTPIWDEVLNDPNYQDIKDDEDSVASEVLSRISGKENAKRFEEQAKKTLAETRGIEEKAQVANLISNVRRALNKFWNWVGKDLFGIKKFSSIEEVTDRVLYDLVNGTDLGEVKNGDVQFHKGKSEDDTKTLMGVHNITEDKLLKAIKMGGLANPSAAIIDTSKGIHNSYGEISLIMPSSMIDKRTGRNAGTFEGDAWTPMYPSVEKRMTPEGSIRMEEDINDVPKEMQHSIRAALSDWIKSYANTALHYLFLHQRGNAPDIQFPKPKYSDEILKAVSSLMNGATNIYTLPKETIKKLTDVYVDFEFNGDKEAFRVKTDELIAKSKNTLERNKEGSILYKSAQLAMDDVADYGYPLSPIERFVKDVQNELSLAARPDVQGTLAKASETVEHDGLSKEYEDWLRGLDNRYEAKEEIFDGFTPSGKRRYIPNTLENVSKLMKKQGRQSSVGISTSFSNFAASVMKSNNTLANIKKKKGKLTSNHQDIEDFENKWKGVYLELGEKLQPDAGAFDDYGLARLQEAAVEKDPQAYLKGEYGITLSDEDAQKLRDLIKAIQEERPAMYFETKFERPVMLEEFAAAVIPSNLDKKARVALQDAGLAIYEYEPGNEEDRKRAVDEAKQEDGVLFRQKDNLDEDLKLEDVLVPTSAVRMPRKPRHNIKAYLNGKSVNRDNMLSVAQQLTKGEPFSLDSNTMLREIKGTVDFSDYYDGTIAEFKALPSDGKTVYEQWEELKSKGYEWHKSPLSNSEYLIDKETGDIYRYANHWGSVASCTWELVGAYDDYNYHIAVSNISDFKAKGYGRIAYPNVSYLQALNQSIVNVKDVLNDPTIDIKPKAREFLENILRDREMRRSTLLNDNDSLIDNRNVRKKREAEPKPREEEGQVERSREAYAEQKVREMETAVTDAAAKMNLGNVVVLTSADGLDGQKKRAKGWFDRRTGKITIVLGNHTSVEDAIKTLMHEAVAHYGLRKLFGKDFDTFLDNVYRNAPPSIRQKIVQLVLRNGWDVRVATEEYLASLAEDTNFEQAKESGWFQRVKELFVGMLRRLTERHKLFDISEDELRYVLWRSYENLTGNGGIMGEAQDVVKKEKLLGGTRTAGEPNILFRQIDQDKIDFDKAIARGKYEHRMRESGFQTVEAMQDSMKSLMELYKAVDEAEKVKREVEDIPDSENAYVGENRLSSVNQAELDDYNRRFFKPLLNSIAALARTDEERQDLFDYMMAKHGLERNEVMALREAQKEYETLNQAAADGKGTAPDWDAILAKHRKRDYSGLTTLMRGDEDEIDTATAEQRAKELVERYEEEKGKADIDNLWYDVNAANAEVLWKMYRGGLLSKEAYHEIADMYKYYIPLRGFDEKTSGEEYAYLMGKNSAFTAPMKTAKGRTSKADNPIAQMALMADSAIMQANRNRLVKIPFLNYVTKHPSDLVSVSDMWLEYDEVNDTWKPKFPEISPEDTPEEVERKVGEFEEKMEELSTQQPDKYVRQGEKGNIPYRVLGSDMREHQVIVKRNGKDYVLTINGNPRAAQAINGLTNPDNKSTGAIDRVFDWIAQGNRWLSSAYTTRNPDFVVSNFIRDTFYSNMMVHVKEGRNYATKFHINHAICNPVMIGRLLHKYNNGELDMNNELQRYFYEFMMNGGETGWTSVKNAEQHKSDIKKALDRGAVGNSVKKIFEGLDHLNRAIENSARFAAFVTSRQMGRQLGRSIYDAKEISVNFNKKGSGSKMLGATGQTWQGNTAAFVSGIGRGLYTFWNASVQGLTNYMRYTHRNPVKGYSLATALFGLGLLIPYVGYLMSGGDDDGNGYYDMPEYVRRSNILIKAGNGWAKITLPQEYRAIYGMGELAMTAMSGKNQMTRGEALLSAAEQLSQVLPIDFMEGGGSWTAAVPTALKPIVEASINKGWTGLPIYKDNPFNKDDPEWAKSYKGVSGELKAVAKLLSDITGGDDYTGGAIDLNPAQIEYVMKGMLGGYYSFMDKVVKTAKMPFGAQPVETKDIPFANRLYAYGDERTKERAINNAYFEYSKEHDHTKKLLRNYEREAEQGSEKYIEKINLMYNEPEYARYLIFEEYSKDIDRLGKLRKEVQGDPDATLEIDKQISDLRKEVVNKLREVK